jgi:hypothetical protein
MSLKNIALAFAAAFALTGSAFAGDLMDDLSSMDVASINESTADIEATDLDALDMDAMADEAGEEPNDEAEAIETCYRHHGGHHCSHGWNNWYGSSSYNHCYSNYNYNCYPTYSYNHCYRPLYTCQPTYTYCQPVIQTQTYCQPVVSHYTTCQPVVTSYWGCY